MLRSYGTIFQLKCARLPPPLTLTLCLLLSCRVLLFLHLSFTLVLKPTSSFSHIPLSLLYLQDGYSGFRPGSPFISFSFSQSLIFIFIHPAIFIYGSTYSVSESKSSRLFVMTFTGTLNLPINCFIHPHSMFT